LIQTTETINGSVRKTYSYNYDAAWNLTKEQNTGVGFQYKSETKVYSYDAGNRIVTAQDNQGSRSYSYDEYGNIVKETNKGKTSAYTYNALNQLLSKTGSGGNSEYSYDKRGNQTEETGAGTFTYVYDETNRMVKGANTEGKESEYTYNGLGYLIRLEQGVKNPNNLFINNHNTGGNRYIGLLEDEANAGITIPEGQQTYEDNYGLTRQREEKTATDYVIDYTGQYAQNLMEYTDGRYVVRNTFSVSKVSQSAYTVDSAINVTGNPSHAIATEDIQKAYFHYDGVGSTVYVSSQAGNLLAYTAYDEWGNNVQNMKELITLLVAQIEAIGMRVIVL
jgi:YD repeat-containing protein